MFSNIVVFLSLLLLGFFFGRRAEKRHYRSLIKREEQMRDLTAIATRFPPEDRRCRQSLVCGNVVIASDYFKVVAAWLVNFFGGSVVSYESLLERGRREAILRMKKEARQLQAGSIFNVKIETSTVGGRYSASIEVLAYGTALIDINEAAPAIPSAPTPSETTVPA